MKVQLVLVMALQDSFLKQGREIMPDTPETQTSLCSQIDPPKCEALQKIQSSDMILNKR